MYGFILTNKPSDNVEFTNRYIRHRGADHTSEVHRGAVFGFDFRHQKKRHFDNWRRSFEQSIHKRAISNFREKIFIYLTVNDFPFGLNQKFGF